MLSVLGPRGRLCDSLSRRELLTVGGLSVVGLSLADILRLQAKACDGQTQLHGFGKASSIIFVYLQGAPSHIDLFDPKPDAPAEIRGEFKAIPTKVPGIYLGEVLPKLARQADKFTLIRSVGCKPKGLPNHGSAIYMLMTGHDPSNFSPTGLAVPPSREDLPSVGSIIARQRPASAGRFSSVAVGGPTKEGVVVGLGQGAGLLGAAYDPFPMYDDATKPINLDVFSLPDDMTFDRLQERVDLRRAFDARVAAESGRVASGESRKATRTESFDAY